MKKPSYALCAAGLLVCAAAFLSGCSELVLLHPKGPVGESERTMILIAFALMLLVVVPVIVMAVWFPLKYRASNKKAEYAPDWGHSGKIELVMWLVPLVIVAVLSTILWRDTHKLDPYKPIPGQEKTLDVQVVSLDWKWLFIYPDQGVATVGELVFPAGTQLAFTVTSDTVMTSFFIPQLGSQIYAMGGMRTHLHLLADHEGTYAGQNQQFSGAGYPDMTFKAVAVSPQAFDAWVQKARQSPQRLDDDAFEALRRPGLVSGEAYYGAVAPGIFDAIVGKYDPMTHHQAAKSDDNARHAGHAE